MCSSLSTRQLNQMKKQSARKTDSKVKMTTYHLTIIALMVATLSAGKFILTGLPNIEIVSLLIILYARFFGKKTFYAVFTFVLIECLIYGLNLWSIMYIYVWPLLVVITLVFRKQTSVWFWSIFSALFGLFFGALCALTQLAIGGWAFAVSWWISGIALFDIPHCIGNFVIMLILFKPLSMALEKALSATPLRPYVKDFHTPTKTDKTIKQ